MFMTIQQCSYFIYFLQIKSIQSNLLKISFNYKFYQFKLHNKRLLFKMPHQEKTIEQYRRDIFALKSKLKDQQQYLKQIQQKYGDLNVFQQKSYSFPIKLKILEYDLNTIKEKIQSYSKEDAYDIYALNYSTLALIKSSQIMGINKQMIFRAIDIQNKAIIDWFDLNNFLKQTMRLSAQLINPILKALDPKQTGKIQKKRYNHYLQCFMINSQQGKLQINTLQQASQRIAKQVIIQKIAPNKIWKGKQLNIATLANGLITNLKNIDVLDAIAFYLKLDPLKNGYIQTGDAVDFLQKKMFDVKNFERQSIKLRK